MIHPGPHPATAALRCCRRWLVVLALSLAAGACVRLPCPPPATLRAPVAADAPIPPIYPNGKPYRSTDEPQVMVWLIADNLHTAMVFPYDWLLASGFVPPAGLGNPPYVTLSWGDRTAYIQHEWLGPWQVARALFTPTPSVMEIIPIEGYVADVCQKQRVWRKLVPLERGPEVAAFLNHVSRTGPDGRPLIVGPSSWGDGFLLDSKYSYYLPRICNVWTAQAMEACGCKVHPLSGLTADGLIRQAEAPVNGFECVWLGDGTIVPPLEETASPAAAPGSSSPAAATPKARPISSPQRHHRNAGTQADHQPAMSAGM